MSNKKFEFEFETFNSIDELSEKDHAILTEARKVTANAYAPYSNFQVGAAALLENGQLLKGTNQENASYPITICAERVLLSSIVTQFGAMPIDTLAVSYFSGSEESSNKPISPCGMCRQALLEYEKRTQKPMRIIMSGQKGEVVIIKSVRQLLPFAFDSDYLE